MVAVGAVETVVEAGMAEMGTLTIIITSTKAA